MTNSHSAGTGQMGDRVLDVVSALQRDRDVARAFLSSFEPYHLPGWLRIDKNDGYVKLAKKFVTENGWAQDEAMFETLSRVDPRIAMIAFGREEVEKGDVVAAKR